MRQRGREIAESLDPAVLQEPQVGLAAGLAGEQRGFSRHRDGVALIDRRVGEPDARAVVGIDAEEIELAALRGVAGVDDAVVAPGEIALGVEVVGEPARAPGLIGEVDDIDVALSVAIEAVIRKPLAVGAEGRIARLDDAVLDDPQFAVEAEVQVDLSAPAHREGLLGAGFGAATGSAGSAAEVLRAAAPIAPRVLGPLQHTVQGPVVQDVRVAALREPGDSGVADGHHASQDGMQALRPRVLIDGDLLRGRRIAPIDQHELRAK